MIKPFTIRGGYAWTETSGTKRTFPSYPQHTYEATLLDEESPSETWVQAKWADGTEVPERLEIRDKDSNKNLTLKLSRRTGQGFLTVSNSEGQGDGHQVRVPIGPQNESQNRLLQELKTPVQSVLVTKNAEETRVRLFDSGGDHFANLLNQNGTLTFIQWEG